MIIEIVKCRGTKFMAVVIDGTRYGAKSGYGYDVLEKIVADLPKHGYQKTSSKKKVKPISIELGPDSALLCCPKCNTELFRYPKYCSECGVAFDWRGCGKV